MSSSTAPGTSLQATPITNSINAEQELPCIHDEGKVIDE